MELNVRGRDDGFYEVEVKLTARAAREADTVFHIEIAYAGLFEIMGVPQAELEPVLMIECPRYLFPFVRRVIADLSMEGGFPPFMLEPIDFAGIYAARRAQTEGPIVGAEVVADEGLVGQAFGLGNAGAKRAGARAIVRLNDDLADSGGHRRLQFEVALAPPTQFEIDSGEQAGIDQGPVLLAFAERDLEPFAKRVERV